MPPIVLQCIQRINITLLLSRLQTGKTYKHHIEKVQSVYPEHSLRNIVDLCLAYLATNLPDFYSMDSFVDVK